MIILNTESEQQFYILPIRQMDENGNDISLNFIDKITKESHIIIGERNSIKDRLQIYCEQDFLVENRFYDLVVSFYYTNEIIYKDIVFCTDQKINEFRINNGNYVMPTIDNNGYIII
jgi:hypothetical protein